jgi:very-short-patch-repair endonuclease
MSPPEARMWNLLRMEPLVVHHFRRQVPIGPYYADFASHSARLIIEVDGASHTTDHAIAYDARRTAFLETAKYRVARFTTTEVMFQLDGVGAAVLAFLGEEMSASGTPTHRLRRSPLPSRGRESRLRT